MPTSAQRTSLVDRVYQHLSGQLATRTRRVGDRLNARGIAEQLGVSRTTVNKAIDRLVEAGWVQADSGRHPVVTSLPTQLKLHEPGPFEFANQTDSTYELFLERILRGDFSPGEIIKERPLAIEMGINPATLRRAAEWLRNDGLLERLPRRGWRVTRLSVRDLEDLFQIRMHLEPMALEGAIQRITDTQLDDLMRETEDKIQLGEEATVYDRRSADLNFHQAIADASGSRILSETLEPLIRRVLLSTTVGFRFGRALRSFEEHRDVLTAIRERDTKKAARLLRRHLRGAMKFQIEVWDRQ